MSREIQQSNKAPRHHNDNFESDKRFIETVAELRDGKIATLAILFRFSFTAYTLLTFGFVVDCYCPITTLISNNMLFLPRNYIKVVIIYINIRL